MRGKLLRTALLLTWLCPALANAGELCADAARRWCFGTMAFTLDDKHVDASLFANDDILVALTENGRTKRMFSRASERREVYFGLSDEEQLPGHVGLEFSLEGPAGLLFVLANAFPDGPSSVPVEPTEKRVDIPAAHMTIVAWRLASGGTAFRLQAPKGEPGRYITGEVRGARPAPLADGVVAAWGPALHVEPFMRITPRP